MSTEKEAPVEQEEKFVTPFRYENDNDKTMGIETAVYQNDHTVKRFTISGGRTVIVRELSGFDMMKIDKIIAAVPEGKREDEYFPTLFHFAVKIDGKSLPIEDFGNLKGKDYNKIKITAQSLNF